MTIGKIRSWLYHLAQILGDAGAVVKGRVGQRIAGRLAGRWTAPGLGRIFRRR